MRKWRGGVRNMDRTSTFIIKDHMTFIGRHVMTLIEFSGFLSFFPLDSFTHYS